MLKDDIKADLLTAYRHAAGLAIALTKICRAEGVLKCKVCGAGHAEGTPHVEPRKDLNGNPG